LTIKSTSHTTLCARYVLRAYLCSAIGSPVPETSRTGLRRLPIYMPVNIQLSKISFWKNPEVGIREPPGTASRRPPCTDFRLSAS
jgi:hypothetical protein